jgi:glycogen debranching enzyme
MMNLIFRPIFHAFLFILIGQSLSQAQAVNKFTIPSNPLELSRIVKRSTFFDAAGRRAAILGTEDGRFEAWVYPIKLLHDFRLTVSIEGGDADIDLTTYAQRVIARPESFTIVYSHPQFTIRETIFSPIHEKGSILLFDVDSAKNLTLMVSFIPDLKPMWPGGLGGQSAGWNGDKKFFVISESRRKFNGLVGSPLAVSGSSTPAHMLASGAVHFVLHIDAQKAQREFVPVIITGNSDGRVKCIEQYDKLLTKVESLYQQTFNHYRRLREEGTGVITPDRDYNLSYEWAKVALDKGFVVNPDLGAGLIAGLGLSTDSARPGFGWFFGGDAFINSFALNGYGDFDTMREAFRFLQKYQRPADNVFPRPNDPAPGKIMHELSQAGGLVRWFEEYPYGYYHADTTPLYIVSFDEYIQQSGDIGFLQSSWESIKKAYAYCLSADANHDGLMDNTIAGLGASELGSLQADLLTDILLASATVKALQGMARMAELINDEPIKREAQLKYEKALMTLQQKFFDDLSGRYAFALTTRGINSELTSWTSVPLAFRLLEDRKAEKTLQTLAGAELSTDWGTRMLASSSSAYDPIAYNNGGVWLFLTGFVAMGEYEYHHSISAFHHLMQTARSAQVDALGFSSEIWSGDFYRPLDTSVPHQLFSSGMIISPFIRGLAGLRGEAHKKRLTVAPQLPASWEALDIKRYRVGSESVSISIRKTTGSYKAVIDKSGDTPYELRFRPAFGHFTKVQTVTVDGKPVEYKIEETSQDLIVAVTARLMKRVEIEIKYASGIEIDVPIVETTPGQRTTGLKFLGLERNKEGVNILVEGLSGHHYKVKVRSSFRNLRIDGAKLITTTGEWRELEIDFDQVRPNLYVKKTVRLNVN